MGRAYLAVAADKERYVPDLIYACVHDLRFDRQMEETRERYLAELVDLAGLRDEAFEAVSAAISRGRSMNRSRPAMFYLLCEFGKRGHEGSRKMLYAFAEAGDASTLCCMCQMDGFEGFRWLIEEGLIGMDNFFSLFCDVKAVEGEEVAKAKLEELALTGNSARDMVAELNRIASRQGPKPKPKRPPISYELFEKELEAADSRYRKRYVGNRFLYRVDRAALVPIAKRLLSEEDGDLAMGCAKVLRRHEFEGKAELLLSGSFDDPAKREAVIEALKQTEHPLVREAAVAWLSQDPPVIEALELLKRNYREGDELLLDSLVGKAHSLDVIDLHMFCSDMNNLVEECSPGNSATILRWAYESTPCAFCREYIFEQLVARGFASQELLEEAQHDAAETTRTFAKQALAGETFTR